MILEYDKKNIRHDFIVVLELEWASKQNWIRTLSTHDEHINYEFLPKNETNLIAEYFVNTEDEYVYSFKFFKSKRDLYHINASIYTEYDQNKMYVAQTFFDFDKKNDTCQFYETTEDNKHCRIL